jgi:hypothetical protein
MIIKRLYYENGKNQKIDMNEFPIAIEKIDELLKNQWEIETESGTEINSAKIKRISKGASKKKINLQVFANSENEFKEIIDKINDVTEYDILRGKLGKIWINEFYMECLAETREPKDFDEMFYSTDIEVTLLSTRPFWIKEKEYIFKYSNITSTNNKNYPLKYPYRYANGMKIVNVQNDAIDSAHFMLRFYGPAVNPMITIAGNPYTVHAVVEAGEYIEINSLKKTVIKKMITGTEVNLFHYKGKNLFRKILPGQHVVQCGNFDFDLTLFEERSEPRWQSSE